jgi:small subunit ribosomal protein S19
MSRSLKKGPYIDPKLLIKVKNALATGANKAIKTWARASVISPEMVGARLGVHNGRDFIEVIVTERMVGHKLGEFSPTRTFRGHSSGKIAKAQGTTGRVLAE